MKRFFVFLFLCLLFHFSGFAQGGTIRGGVFDAMFKEGLNDAKVTLLRADSTVVAATKAQFTYTTEEIHSGGVTRYMRHPNRFAPAEFSFKVEEAGAYLLKVEMMGYETLWKAIDVAFSGNKPYDAGTLNPLHAAINLKEAGVSGTLLKMVYKGDTLVYNAAAFQTAEGDMLGNLIEKLPGAEIKEGKIYVNGRFIESLLINGKDFFSGNVEQALRSLPAFTVNKIKVFDKKGIMSEMTGADMHDNIHVMDVRLKKEYETNWNYFLSANGGTGGRFNVSGSVWRYAPHQMLHIMGEANNTNELSDYEMGGTRQQQDGIHYNRSAGVTYSYEPNNVWRIGASGNVVNQRVYSAEHTAKETYMTQANTYGRSESGGKNVTTTSQGSLSVTFRPKKDFYLDAKYKVDYENNHQNTAYRTSTYLINPDRLFNSAALDSTFSLPAQDSLLYRWVQTRLKEENLNKGHNLSNGFTLEAKQAFDINMLTLKGEIHQSNDSHQRFNLYHLDYPHAGTATEDYRHRFYEDKKNHLGYYAETNYVFKYLYNDSVNGQLTAFYDISQDYDYSSNPLYRLDWGEKEKTDAIGLLPSTVEALMSTLDAGNTYYSWLHNTQHDAGLRLQHEFRMRNHSWMKMQVELPCDFQYARLNYERNNQRQRASRTATIFNPYLCFDWRPLKDDRYGRMMNVELGYSSTGSIPSLFQMLDMTDSSNPLSVWQGNPSLKNTRKQRTYLMWSRSWKKEASVTSFRSGWFYSVVQNAIATQSTYDYTTGVSHSRPVNIDGNWSLEWNNWFVRPLDKRQVATLSCRLNWAYLHSKDLNSWSSSAGAQQTVSQQSIVRTSKWDGSVRVEIRPSSKWSIDASAAPAWNHVTGSRADFTTINVWDVEYALGTHVQLPWDMSFDNSLSAISHYGYTDRSMCDTRVLWDASLTRDFKHGLKFIVQASDLLHQKKSITSVIDAQGRTERFAQVLPAYFMIGLEWHFAKIQKSGGKKK